MNAKGAMLGWTVACWMVPIWIAGWRWKKLLQICEVQAPYLALVLAALIGQFFALFLPGPLGDDTARVLYLTRRNRGRSGPILSSVMVDRIVGLTGLLLMGATCLPFHWPLLSAGVETRLLVQLMLGAAVGLAVGGGGLLLMGPERFSSGLHWVNRRMPKLISATPAITLLNSLYQRRSGLVAVLLGAIASQLALCASFYFAGRAVSIEVPFFSWMAFVPVVLAAGALPITIAGVGVRDYLMVLFLGAVGGVDWNQAVAASMIILGASVFVAILGGVVFLFHRPEPRAESHLPAGAIPFDSNFDSEKA